MTTEFAKLSSYYTLLYLRWRWPEEWVETYTIGLFNNCLFIIFNFIFILTSHIINICISTTTLDLYCRWLIYYNQYIWFKIWIKQIIKKEEKEERKSEKERETTIFIFSHLTNSRLNFFKIINQLSTLSLYIIYTNFNIDNI